MKQPTESKNPEATGQVVPVALTIAELGIMQFLKGQGFLLLSMTNGNEDLQVLGNCTILNTPFLH